MNVLHRKLLNAKEGSRELDALCWAHLGYTWDDDPTWAWALRKPLGPSYVVNDRTFWQALLAFPADFMGVANAWSVPELTTSTDAALELLRRYDVGREGLLIYRSNDVATVSLLEPHQSHWLLPVSAPTLPLALVTTLVAVHLEIAPFGAYK